MITPENRLRRDRREKRKTEGQIEKKRELLEGLSHPLSRSLPLSLSPSGIAW
jgi:hypothetical protein